MWVVLLVPLEAFLALDLVDPGGLMRTENWAGKSTHWAPLSPVCLSFLLCWYICFPIPFQSCFAVWSWGFSCSITWVVSMALVGSMLIQPRFPFSPPLANWNHLFSSPFSNPRTPKGGCVWPSASCVQVVNWIVGHGMQLAMIWVVGSDHWPT